MCQALYPVPGKRESRQSLPPRNQPSREEAESGEGIMEEKLLKAASHKSRTHEAQQDT